MRRESALVFDLGTSSLKAGLFDGTGNRLAFVRLPYGEEIRPDFYGRTAHTILQTSCRAVSLLMRQAPEAAVTAVVTGGNGPSWVFLDKSGEVLGPVFSWMRGDRPLPGVASRYLKLLNACREMMPDLYSRTALFLPLSDYLPYYLTGCAAAALSSRQLKDQYWDEDQCRLGNFFFDRLPDYILSGQRLGFVGKDAGRLLGIPEGVPVYAGAPDYVMGLIGAGAMSPGAAFNRTGTSEALNVVVSGKSGRGIPFWDGLNTESVFLPPAGIRFQQWFSAGGYSDDELFSKAEALAGRRREEFSVEAFASGERMLEQFELDFAAAVDEMRGRGYLLEEVIAGGSQAESPAWIIRKGLSCGIRLRIPRYAACELVGGAVLAAAEENRGRVAGLSLEFSRPFSL